MPGTHPATESSRPCMDTRATGRRTWKTRTDGGISTSAFPSDSVRYATLLLAYRSVLTDRQTIDDVVQYTRKLNTVEHLFDTNEELTRGILNHGLEHYNISQSELDEFIQNAEKQGKSADRTSVNQAVKHYVRDWAAEGARERVVFEGILDAISEFKHETKPQTPLKVLLPGAGLGRLGHEIDALGDTEVTINEYSAYMALAYHYLTTLPPNSQTFHPFIDWWSHHATTADMQRPATFPETTPSASITLVEGDFTTIFANKTAHFDVLVTFFFIDTAQNLMTYLETIHALLRPGGLWVNLGPLLYGTAPFLQLSLEEVLLLGESMGFELRDGKEEYGRVTVPGLKARTVEALYGSNERGLSWNGYKGQFWIARRK